MVAILTMVLAFGSGDEQRICELINQRRAENGRPALVVSEALYTAAKHHSDDMAENGCYQHDSCNGGSWSTRVRRYYPNPSALGETINFGGTPEEIVSTWMSSDTHRPVLLSTAFREVGCAATLRETNFGEWNMATADFGCCRGVGPTGTPRPTATPGQTVAPVAIEWWQVRRTKTRTTLTTKVLVPSGGRVDAPVSLELDGALVAALSDECVAPIGRGARSVCGTARLRIAPAGVPYYRLRLEVPGVHEPTSVRLSAMGQSWEMP